MNNEIKTQVQTNKNEWLYWIISETSFFAFLYYVQYLLKVEDNLWVSSLVLWLLLNLSMILCPVLRKCCK